MPYLLVMTYKGKDPMVDKDLVGGFICPDCGKSVGVAGDQMRGEVSTVCPFDCGFHVWFKTLRVWMPNRYVVRWKNS